MDKAQVSVFPPEGDRTLEFNGRTLIYPEQMAACFVPVLNGEYAAPFLPDEPVVRHVLDVGAACGGFALWALARWPASRVTCVEPDPELRRYLALNVPEAKIMGCAVSDKDTVTAPLHIGPEGHRGFNTLDPHTTRYPWHEGTIEVAAVIPQTLPAADVLKIDAEGIELALLRGYPWLDAAWWVIFEWHGEDTRRRCEEVLEIHDFHLIAGRTQDRDMGEQTWCRTKARMHRRGVWEWRLPEKSS